jgi:c-di-GMP-binding flagellar brake protein YcgR
MENRRRSFRTNLDTEVWIGQDGIFTRTKERLTNLSAGGAFVETAEGFSVGSVLSLRFRLPDNDAFITCAAIVRNLSVGYGMGVEFLDLSRANRAYIAELIDRALAGPAPR